MYVVVNNLLLRTWSLYQLEVRTQLKKVKPSQFLNRMEPLYPKKLLINKLMRMEMKINKFKKYNKLK